MTDLAAELSRLDTAARAAGERLARARAALRTDRTHAELVVPLVLKARRQPIELDPRAETDRLLKEIASRGLTLELATVAGGNPLKIVDPSLREELDEASAASIEASRALRNFTREHAAELAAEREAARRREFAEAVGSADVDRVRELVGAAA